MNAQVPASMTGTDQISRDRLGRLRAEASNERVAREARADRSQSRNRTIGLEIVVRKRLAGTTEGIDR